MRLLKTHSHTSERLGYKARKTRRKAIEGKRRRYDKANQRQTPPVDRQRGGGRREEGSRLKENAGAVIRETNIKTLPRTASVAGGARRRKVKTKTKCKGGTTYSPARGGSA